MSGGPEPSPAAKALLAGYGAHVDSLQIGDDAELRLQSILRRIDRGEAPLPLLDAPSASRPRRVMVLAIAAVGTVAAIAAAVALWLPRAGLWDATAATAVDPQAAYQHGDGGDDGALEEHAGRQATHDAAAATGPRVPAIASPAVEASASTASAVVAVPSATPSVAEATPVPRTRARPRGAAARLSAPTATDAADLLAQVRVLAQARTALRDGDAAGALARLEADRRAHPSSEYGEERDLLVASALCELGRHRDARAAASRFRRDHPGSPLAARLPSCPDEQP